MTKRKFYKTIFRIEVLCEDERGFDDLDEICYAVTEGDCSGMLTTETKEVLNGKEMAKELKKQGSDPSFFMLTNKGEDIK